MRLAMFDSDLETPQRLASRPGSLPEFADHGFVGGIVLCLCEIGIKRAQRFRLPATAFAALSLSFTDSVADRGARLAFPLQATEPILL